MSGQGPVKPSKRVEEWSHYYEYFQKLNVDMQVCETPASDVSQQSVSLARATPRLTGLFDDLSTPPVRRAQTTWQRIDVCPQ